MAASFNKVIMAGTLGGDPELRYTADGTALTTFSIAVNRRYKDKEETDWFRVVCWGKTAELAGEYLEKGKSVLIDGELRTRSWEAPDGQKRYATEIHAFKVQFLSNGNGKRSDDRHPMERGASKVSAAAADFDPDDIPFE